MGAISMGGKGSYREDYLPIIQQVQHVEFGNAEAMETAIKNLHTVGEEVAGVIIEPVQGEAGVIIPPKGYLTAVREICDKYGVAMICDEIQTGMGRCGTMWRVEVEDVVPDIMTYGKAFGGGVMPITGIIARPKMWTQKLIDNPWILGSPTFGGNPLACSAAIATIKYMLENDIPKQCEEKGNYFMEKLEGLKKKYPTVLKEIRGAGLLICMEFPEAEVGYEVVKGMFSRKVMTAGTLVNAKTVRIEPPAVIEYATIDQVISRLDESIADAKAAFKL
jgi:putrescine aminotransferase